MKNELKNILSNSNKDIDNQELLGYLSNQLTNAESHKIEQQMADDEFMNDAIEGLQQINDKKNIPIHLEELYAGLQKQVAKKNERKKRRWKDNPQTYFIILFIIILIMICFIVIKKITDTHKQQPITSSNHGTYSIRK